MAIYDYNGTISTEIGKLYDYDGTTNYQIGKVYDFDGTTNSLIYTFGDPAGPYEWTSPDMSGGNVYGALSSQGDYVKLRPLWQAFDRTGAYNAIYGVLYPNEWLRWDLPSGESHLIFKWQLEFCYNTASNILIEALGVSGKWHTVGRVNPATGATGFFSGTCDLGEEITAVRLTQQGSYLYYKALQFWGY